MTSLHEFPDDVALARPPRTRCDRVIGGTRRPQTEAVVMLHGQDERSSAGVSRGARPLTGVERRRREDRRVLMPVAPLAIGEGIHTEVQEERELVTLPGKLRRRRTRARRRRTRLYARRQRA